MIERIKYFLPLPILSRLHLKLHQYKKRPIELEIYKKHSSDCHNSNLSLLLFPQWEMMMISWVWASSQKPSPPTLRSPYLTSCLNRRKATSSKINPSISTAKQHPPRRFTSNATANGSIRRTTPSRSEWTKTQVSAWPVLLNMFTDLSERAKERWQISPYCEKWIGKVI